MPQTYLPDDHGHSKHSKPFTNKHSQTQTLTENQIIGGTAKHSQTLTDTRRHEQRLTSTHSDCPKLKNAHKRMDTHTLRNTHSDSQTLADTALRSRWPSDKQKRRARSHVASIFNKPSRQVCYTASHLLSKAGGPATKKKIRACA